MTESIRRAIVALSAGAALALPAGAALAQYEQPTSTPTVEGTSTTRGPTGAPTTGPSVLGERTARPNATAVTGADVLGIAALGLGTLGAGTALVAAGRRRRRDEA